MHCKALGALLALSLVACAEGDSRSPGATTAAAVTTQTPIQRSTLTRHPLVLVNGIFAVQGQLGTNEYFYGVPARLRSIDCEVLVASTSAINGVEVHAVELRDQIVAAYPDPQTKVNIVAHSMGGLDARAMIARQGMGDRVASLTTIATPHGGSPVAEVAVGLIPGNVQQSLDTLLGRLGLDWDGVVDLSTTQVGVFNQTTPDDPRVFYQSYGASSDPFGNVGAKTHAMLWASWGIVWAYEGENDGLVSVTSARWGQWNGVLPTDHLGEIGHVPGQTAFDHLTLYEDIARDLAARGF